MYSYQCLPGYMNAVICRLTIIYLSGYPPGIVLALFILEIALMIAALLLGNSQSCLKFSVHIGLFDDDPRKFSPILLLDY